MQILKFLRFSDPNTVQPDDPMCRIRDFIAIINSINQHAYTPERRVSVDESLMKWKGRSMLRRYIPTKRARYGILTM